MNNRKETLCWGCKRSVIGGCPWMDRKEAVPGWKAEKTHITCENAIEYDSYCVSECPIYRKGYRWEV